MHVNTPLAYKLLQIPGRRSYFQCAAALVCVHGLFFLGRDMKFSAIVCCGLVAAGSASTVFADPYQRGMGLPSVQVRRAQPAVQGEAERPKRERQPRGSGENDHSRERMSPEERHQLRRDIQDAGKDIYYRERQRRADPRRSRDR